MAFGPSLTVLIIVNLGILAAIATMLYTFVRSVTDYLTATVAGFILLAVFGFSQYVGTGNYNYVTPYVHEATHGIALALGMMVLFGQYVAGGARRAIAGAGVCLGLAVLTKVDVATATIAVAAIALPAIWWLVRADRPIRVGDVALFAAGAATPALLFFVYFLTYLPAGPGVQGRLRRLLRSVPGGRPKHVLRRHDGLRGHPRQCMANDDDVRRDCDVRARSGGSERRGGPGVSPARTCWRDPGRTARRRAGRQS